MVAQWCYQPAATLSFGAEFGDGIGVLVVNQTTTLN
ncbi:hypothetical protein LVISKB_1989 [Levilactobacillus brevis KB290]|uniref:Uncharacterized protein n=1 Tax=Levilactobacillus brevis KB290 TaxID=1001583 RepID=M5AFN1_LEVBR|nr:hypothetical protein LVISKB_1989 [Levilactobacillus brevis KB290]